MKTIAIIEDDVHIGNLMEEAMGQEQYQVLRAYSGTEALYLLEKNHPDLIILDLMLPGISGEELLGKLEGIPVIVVSAKVGIDDRVKLLLGGAADYITKPFAVQELLARIAVQFRRQTLSGGTVLEAGRLRLTPASYEVQVGGREVKLTRTEYAILKLLMKHPTQVITKSVLLDSISWDTPDCTESSLKMHVSNLRKKLRAADGWDYIEAVWGIGFKLRIDD
jgi:DNA-binding response OmpR family regulator